MSLALVSGTEGRRRELAMLKKAWKKPEVKQIQAGAAEKNAGGANDGAANKS
jgi:hypothetical protein